MKGLERLAAEGGSVHLLREEDLMSNTRDTLSRLLKGLSWNWTGEISAPGWNYCCFQERSSEDRSDKNLFDQDPERVALDQLVQSFGIQTYGVIQT